MPVCAEKALVAFLNGQVPIVHGAPNVHEFLPPNSYIDITAFSSIAELAAYLRHLESLTRRSMARTTSGGRRASGRTALTSAPS